MQRVASILNSLFRLPSPWRHVLPIGRPADSAAGTRPVNAAGKQPAWKPSPTTAHTVDHVQQLMPALLEHISGGELRPEVIIIHRRPLSEAARGYELFDKKLEHCRKVVLTPG